MGNKTVPPFDMWLIVNAKRQPFVGSLRETRRMCIANFLRNGPDCEPDKWEYWRRRGYRAVRVTITEAAP